MEVSYGRIVISDQKKQYIEVSRIDNTYKNYQNEVGVQKLKHNVDGSIARHKVRLITRRFFIVIITYILSTLSFFILS